LSPRSRTVLSDNGRSHKTSISRAAADCAPMTGETGTNSQFLQKAVWDTCLKTGVAVEKLLLAKFAKIKSRQEAPQSIFSGRVNIFYPQNFGCLKRKGSFSTPRLVSTTNAVASGPGFPRRNGRHASWSSRFQQLHLSCCSRFVGLTLQLCRHFQQYPPRSEKESARNGRVD